MKKFINELNDDQKIVYRYLIKNPDTVSGISFNTTISMLEEQCECVPENVSDCFSRLSTIEIIEVIHFVHFVTKYILRKHS